MKPERWQQLDSLFHDALSRGPEERAAFMDRACAGDEELRRQVEALLAAHEEAGSFIESPAMEVAARELAVEQENAETAIASGETVGHYRIIAPLGSGGMGEVYLAEDTVLNRQVAVKLLPEFYTRDRDRLRRFQQEARTASALNHPNIITTFEVGEVGGRQFIVTEFIDGATLADYLPREGQPQVGRRLQLREKLDIAIQTADALAAAHEAHVVHRDIKPENIMLRRRDGYVKVLDFGLAKLTEDPAVDIEATTRIQTSSGTVMGTATYMSPEQARGEKVDPRTDIWSLGVVLYEMVAGTVPFKRPTPSEVIALILEREPPPLARYDREVPAELERIVSKALSKDRESRFQTAKELLIDLRRLRQRLDVEAEIERAAQLQEKGGEEAGVTVRGAAAQTRGSSFLKSKSRAAYLFNQITLHRRGALAGLALLAAVMALTGYFIYSRRGASGGANIEPAPGIRSVAVLPFANTSQDPETEYLSDGISESLINRISQLPGVKVSARASSFMYKDKEIDPQEVAKALGVEAILTGRVTQRGDNLSISVELMDARDKTQMWGAQYNRKATDVLAVQAEISREIAETLRLRLTTAEQQQLAKRETVNPQAYELLLKGRFHFYKGTGDLKRAAGYYENAIAVDPNYALAYAELSHTYSTLIVWGIFDPKEFTPKAEAAAHRALELDEGLAEAHLALAVLKMNAWEWTAAEREFKRAVELNPNLAVAHVRYSMYFIYLSQHDKAIDEIRRARELDPLSPAVNTNLGLVLGSARRYDQAIDSLKQTLELDQNHSFTHVCLGYNYAWKGMYTEAIAAYQMGIKLGDSSPSTQIFLGAAYAKAGEHKRAEAILKRLQTSKEYVSPAELADLYVALGKREQAFASLEKGYAAHDLQLQYIGADPFLDPLRSDPRFHDIMRRVGLTP